MATPQPPSLPAQVSDATIFVQHDKSDSRILYNSLKEWKSYPYNLGPSLQPRNRLKLFEHIKRQHERTKHTALLFIDESWGPARKNAVERRIRTVWFDCNPSSASSTELSGPKPDSDSDKPRRIKSDDQLEEFFCITSGDSVSSPDPLCRFMYVFSLTRPGPVTASDQLHIG